MHRIDFLGISVNVAASLIVIVSVTLAVVMYREPKAAEEPTPPVITELVNAATSTLRIQPTRATATEIVRTSSPTATLRPTNTIAPTTTATPTRPAVCVALPKATATAAPGAAAAPIPISTYYDLDPQIGQRDKALAIVFHCNGSFDAYWLVVNPGFLGRIKLLEGDVIYDVIPPASLGASKTPTPTPTRAVTRATATP